MTGGGERPVRADVPGGQGVQAGDGNVQVNVFGQGDAGAGDGQDVCAGRSALTAGRDLTVHFHPSAAGQQEGAAGGPRIVGDIPRQPPGFQPRAELLAALDAAGPGVLVVHAITGMRGVGKTQLAAAYARGKVAARWRLVAWVNAEDAAALTGGLATVAEEAGVAVHGGDPGLAVRHWLEADGERCLLVFDNANDPDLLRPYLPVTGAARVLVTSNQGSVAELGEPVGVEVFTPEEAAAYLAVRTGLADSAEAGEVAAELGCLPLGLAQAAAVIRAQRLSYGSYLERLRALPVADYLTRQDGQPYPHGVAEAVLLSLQGVQAGDRSGACAGVMELLGVLSPAGVRRDLLHAAGQAGALSGGPVASVVVDEALGRLAGASLVTFSVDGTSVTAHRLVMRVVREQAAARNTLPGACTAAGGLLDELAGARERSWHEDRAAVRDLIEQIIALHGASAACRDDADVARLLIRLRWWAVWFLNNLGDNVAQATGIAEGLLADQERVLGRDHPDSLRSRNNLAIAYQDAGRTAEAIVLYERNLVDIERVLGPDHPDTLQSRNNLASVYRKAGRTG